MPRRVLIGGGVRSGKSAFALRLAQGLGPRRAFVATAQAFDAEMRARIDAHVAERGDAFVTHEAPHALEVTLAGLRDEVDVVVVDCLTLWLSNLLLEDRSEAEIGARVDGLADVLAAAPFHAIVVSNEVGMGIVPEHRLGRVFRDVSGRAHQRLARLCDAVYIAMLGIIVRAHPVDCEEGAHALL
jgi:adenosylcobinamide kinase/adenosylcobinamide-phosphate guanylyltransferase